MNKLEQAVHDMDDQFFPKFKMTISERAERQLKEKIRKNKDLIAWEKRRTDELIAFMERQTQQMEIANTILAGKQGYIRMTQDTAHMNLIEPGFTTFEEIVEIVATPLVKVSFEPLSAGPGDKVFQICENGMMILFAQKVDSSD